MKRDNAPSEDSDTLLLDANIVRYLDEELPTQQREEFFATQSATPALGQRLDELRELSTALQNTVAATAPPGAPPARLTYPRRTPWRRWVAGVVFASALAAAWSPVRAWWVEFRDDASRVVVPDAAALPGPSENAVGFRPSAARLVVRIEQAPSSATLVLAPIEGDVAWMEAGGASEVVVGPEGFAVEATESAELSLRVPPSVTSIVLMRAGEEVGRYNSEAWQERVVLPLN